MPAGFSFQIHSIQLFSLLSEEAGASLGDAAGVLLSADPSDLVSDFASVLDSSEWCVGFDFMPEGER